jgi:CDP-glucose 4,6-dehydratase
VGVRRGAVAAVEMRRPDPGFWNGKRVLLTGHTGFKGGWAAIWLSRMGANVTGLALPPDPPGGVFDLARVAELVDSRLVDLRDRTAVAGVVDAGAFDVVLHMAAQPIVRRSIAEPVETFASNVMGTAHLLDALRARSGLQAVLVITSDKVYANAETGEAFAEGAPLGGKDPYSASKAATEILTASFARSYFDRAGVPVATARGGNVIGGGDVSPDRLVSDIVRAVGARRGGHPAASRGDATLAARAGLRGRLPRLRRGPGAGPGHAPGAEFRAEARRRSDQRRRTGQPGRGGARRQALAA